MKILLFYPNLYGMNTLPPAIGIFTAILKKAGHNLALFDTTIYKGLYGSIDTDMQKSRYLNARPYDDSVLKRYAKNTSAEEDFRKIIKGFKPRLIAMSVTEDMYPVGMKLLSALGKNRPPVVAGGVFPTFAPELAIKHLNNDMDMVLMGEGEVTLPELCNRIERGSDITDIDGLCMVKDNRLIKNKLPRPAEINEDILPDYSLFEASRFYRPMHGMMRRMLPITTIRGCPYTCGFCNSPSQRESYRNEGYNFFRKKKIKLIYKELKYCLEVYKADSFYFWADTFLSWNDLEFDEFCEMYSEFNLPFWIQTRPENVTEYRFRRLKEIGLLRAAFGIEHGNEKFRERILLRKIKNAMIIKNLNIVTNLGIPISVNNIIGFPRETRKLAFDTIELNRFIKSDGINAYAYTPFHGTPLRGLAEALGCVRKGSLARCINKPTIISMPQFPKEEIQGLLRCFVLYAKMPKNRWKDIKMAEKCSPKGNKIWKELREECSEKYLEYGG